MAQREVAQRKERVVIAYIRACNEADAGAVAACLAPDVGDAKGGRVC